MIKGQGVVLLLGLTLAARATLSLLATGRCRGSVAIGLGGSLSSSIGLAGLLSLELGGSLVASPALVDLLLRVPAISIDQ